MKYAIILALLLSFNANASDDCKYILDATQSFKKGGPVLYAAILEEAVEAYSACKEGITRKAASEKQLELNAKQKNSVGVIQHFLSIADTNFNAVVSNTKALVHSAVKPIVTATNPNTE